MKVTIVIPIFNVEQYIVKCITSVMQQTFIGEIECLLIDDCGTDNSVEMAKETICGYSGNIEFRMIHHRANKGLSAARNTGIREAKGEWIYFLDSDDYVTADCIDTLVKVAKNYPKSQIIQGGAITSTGYPVHIDMESDNGNIVDYMDEAAAIKKSVIFCDTCYSCSVWNKLIRKSFILDNHLFFKEGVYYEDTHWQFFAAKYLKAVAFARKNTYVYTIRENSIMGKNGMISSKKSMDSWYQIALDFLNNIDDFCYMDQVRRTLYISIPIYRDAHDQEYVEKFRGIIIALANMCSEKDKQIIMKIVNVPRWWLRTHDHIRDRFRNWKKRHGYA